MSNHVDDLLQNRSDITKLDLALQLVLQVLGSVGDLADEQVSLKGARDGIAAAMRHLSYREGDLEERCK